MRPGCSSSPGSSTSTRTRASRTTPIPIGSSRIRWRPRSAARRRSSRSTTRAPGSSPAAERSLLTGMREWRAATRRATVPSTIGLSLAVSGHADDPIAELPATIDAGVATSKAFMVFDFRLPDQRLFEAMRAHGPARRDAPGPLRGPRPARRRRRRQRLQRGDVSTSLPRYNATKLRRGGRDGTGARVRPDDRGARSTSSTSRRPRRSTRSGAPRRPGSGSRAETCPHYLVLTDERYDDPDPASCARFVISPPLRSPADRDALWAGLADGSLDLVATDHVPDRLDTEKAEAADGVPFNQISNGAPGIETLLTILYSEGVRHGPDHPRADGRPPGDDARPAGSGSRRRAPSRSAATPTSSCSIRRRRRTIRAADLHHTSDYTPYEGLEVTGAVRTSSSAAERSSATATSSGRAGPGQFRRARRPLRLMQSTCISRRRVLPRRALVQRRVRPQRQELGEVVVEHQPIEQLGRLGQPALPCPTEPRQLLVADRLRTGPR